MTDDERRSSQRERTARYRARHRERVLAQGRAQSKKWHAAHRDEACAAMRAAYKKHRAERRAQAKAKLLLLNRDDESARRKALWALYKKRWNASRRLQRAKDPQAARSKQSAWRAANVEAARLKEAQYRAKPEQRAKAVARTAAWMRKHPEWWRSLQRIGDAKRRAREHEAFVEAVDPRVVFTRDGGICGICMKSVDPSSRWEVDHIIPIARGGLHSYANVQLSHRKCNRAKGYSIVGVAK